MTSRWLALLAMTRAVGTLAAVGLLVAHQVTANLDPTLTLFTLVWGPLSIWAFVRLPRLHAMPAAWILDSAVALGLIWLSGDWRSPFYVFAITTLVLPVTTLPFRAAMVWGSAFTAAYLVLATSTERLNSDALQSTISLETVATHLMVPLLVTLALAYGSELLERLHNERERGERLAVQTERQRIAWELHDSAKQRVHAAHLVLSALESRLPPEQEEIVEHGLAELRAATADMETSVAELRMPLEGRPVDVLLRERAEELGRAGEAEISVEGRLPPLPPLVATHAYRIAAEALTNAVRHARAAHIAVSLEPRAIEVRDDGVGMPAMPRPGSNGLRSMRGRAETIGARLVIAAGAGSRGTAVRLELPLDPDQEGATV